jgi:hypothetical protein
LRLLQQYNVAGTGAAQVIGNACANGTAADYGNTAGVRKISRMTGH